MIILVNQISKGGSMSVTNLSDSTASLLDAIDQEWSALMQVVDQLTSSQMITPDEGGWSPKDNLAHLTEWMKILLGYHMDRRPAHEVLGVAPEVTRDWDMDVMNKILFERNQARPFGEVLDELKRVYSEVVARLKAVPFEELMKPRHVDDPEQQPLLNWVLGNTSGHFAEHRVNIEKLLKT
jgi:hypothetical protein